MTVVDFLGRDDFPDHWCANCGGYATRRLKDTQLSYYRAAHRLHTITRQLDRRRHRHQDVDSDVIKASLDELADWRPMGEASWWGADSWVWTRLVQDLRTRVVHGSA
ncbi:hypothetical protein [Streptomyces sp. SID3343]|uniref:hypothetical protein n=1 Tax=Streptomyces sp. SID3343 TaxID=2690260 RepID=UPI00137148F8|nr:hypothetical protein [Streptomyces sp. SID3343]MYW01839.1 hypothetical protein [Streptomyces sp. SID3343]MYW02274.1 hypothetical protein [Streptomyces sp. SID3343]